MLSIGAQAQEIVSNAVVIKPLLPYYIFVFCPVHRYIAASEFATNSKPCIHLMDTGNTDAGFYGKGQIINN
ncbi:hypothetical protein SAMN06298226_0062 [Nitrosovibrio sp. Nv4]|nr:hypothetical protein SAMN06298226_0062 [Nitrosovibrio sp. Nv4]